ncbi:hypothetical protein [Catenisphaera adipataccumulans]|jgi:hypothetical protein|uniref:Uncharacterized protein n=1 Tax=Catenisphaera adipataccumulans TaxID=700500 RepID=A0A7W8CW49_9FIRM|nr:hypothetical protein [Catenisphaera adipataccumulans]MBB5182054.1 hypothetical protein [Catenisphaera adipataccumulans]
MNIYILLAVICILFGIYPLLKVPFRRMRLNRLQNELQYGQFENFEKDLESPMSRWVFTPYNIEYARLNEYLVKGEDDKLGEQYDKLINLARTKQARLDIYTRAFEYYAMNGNKERSEPLLDEIRMLNVPEAQAHAELIWDIFILKKSNHINELKEASKDADALNRGMYAYLIAEQYRNRGDEKNAEKYEAESKKYL